jgi:hypothetical protein
MAWFLATSGGLELGETGIVLVTQAADFVFDGRHVKVTSDAMLKQGIGHANNAAMF